MLHREKDPSLKTLLLQEALKARGLYTGDLDNWWGKQSQDAYDAFVRQFNVSIEHVAQASTFAYPADIAAFKRCKAEGKSDKECFNFGDNGEGKWGDDTTTESVALCALHKDYLEDRFGSNWDPEAHSKWVDVTVNGLTARCRIGDICGVHGRIDLNPGAYLRLGMKAGDLVDATWRWV